MKKVYLLASLILLAPVTTQAQEEGRIESTGGMTIGVQQVEVEPDSAKFTEYRDIREGFYFYDLWFDVLDTGSGLFMDFSGENLIRDDQTIHFRLGDYSRRWQLRLDRHEIPHNLSNKAKTPFFNQGDGLFSVPSPVLDAAIVGIPNNSANTADMLQNDQDTATWLATHLHNTDLGTQRDKTSATLQYSPLAELKFRLTYSDEQKDGAKITYGPIGNRPPNTLNIQFTEPIDYLTRELKFEAEFNQPTYQALFTYLYSDFEDDLDTLRWQNIWAFDPENPLGYTQASSNGGSQRLATFGQRALAPDNRYQNISLALGVDLPMASRLTATAAYGMMEQEEALLPYSSSDFGSPTAFSSTAALPRQEADAEIDTKLLNVDYTVNPLDRLNLRAFIRYYDLDNDSPQDNWRYITSDAIPDGDAASGLPTFKNQRTNLAYAYDQWNYGLDTSYNLVFWRTTLGLGYEREEIDRDFREANTEENIFTGSARTRPADWLTLQAKYLFGDREGDGYNTFVTAASYWYDPTSTTNLDNPAGSFTNHPDMRKFDVIDRERNQFDLAATITPLATLDLTASYHFQDDDFDAGVTSTQPLLGNALAATAADQQAATPGDQLGLLARETQRYALDASYAAFERLTLTAFGSRETIESEQRGLEFNENNKLNPESSGLNSSNELGAWNRASSQWSAKTDDETDTVGFGAGYEIIPAKLNFIADYVFSRGEVDIAYSGFGTQSALDPANTLADDHPFAFRNPPTVTHHQYTLNASLEYQWVENLVFGLHYIFDRYEIADWMQEADQPWFEAVGSEYLLRDTSESHQWGNRLVNLGSYLGPTYEAHVGSVTMTFRF